MPEQEGYQPVQISGDLVHGDKNVLSGMFTGTVNVGSTIIHQVTGAFPAAEPAKPRIFLSYGWDNDKYFRLAMMMWQGGSPESAEPLLAQAVELGRQIDPNHRVTRHVSEQLAARGDTA